MVDGEFFFLSTHVSFLSRNSDGGFALPGHQTMYYIIVVYIGISTFGRPPRRAFSPVDFSRSLFRSVSLRTRVRGGGHIRKPSIAHTVRIVSRRFRQTT